MKPVAWMYRHKKHKLQEIRSERREFDAEVIEETPLYTAPRGLSDEEIDEIEDACTTLPPKPWKGIPLATFDKKQFAKAILKKASE